MVDMGCTYFNCFTFLVRDLSFATTPATLAPPCLLTSFK